MQIDIFKNSIDYNVHSFKATFECSVKILRQHFRVIFFIESFKKSRRQNYQQSGQYI
jgi:predicted HicB family RNase H-like nuclease